MPVRLTPGALWLRFRVRYGQGLRVAYYRDRVRLRILATPPIPIPKEGRCEVHVLTSIHDWLNLMWGLKSLYQLGGCAYPLCIHDDGTLGSQEIEAFRHHFAGARIITRQEANEIQSENLAPYPRARHLRDTNPLALKILDFKAFLTTPRMFLLDSDVLFFSPPRVLYQRIDDNYYKLNTLNKDWGYAYTIDLENPVIRELPFSIPPLINSGLGLIHSSSIDFEWIEYFLSLPDMLSHGHRIEQTLFALCSARHGFEFLPSDYDVHLGPFRPEAPIRHFTGPIRPRLYREGIRHLVKCGFCA